MIIWIIAASLLAGLVILAAIAASKRRGWMFCCRCRLYFDICGERAATPPPGSLLSIEYGLCPSCEWETRVRRGACGKYKTEPECKNPVHAILGLYK